MTKINTKYHLVCGMVHFGDKLDREYETSSKIKVRDTKSGEIEELDFYSYMTEGNSIDDVVEKVSSHARRILEIALLNSKLAV